MDNKALLARFTEQSTELSARDESYRSGEQLLVEVEDLLRALPRVANVGEFGAEYDWLGRASAIVRAWNPSLVPGFKLALMQLQDRHGSSQLGYGQIVTMLHECRHDLRMKTQGPIAVALETGQVFRYFDEVRKKVELATSDVMFVDPYLDADFVSNYVPCVPEGVSIRLLAREKIATLKPAIELYRTQTSAQIEVRSCGGFHDRFVFVDSATGFHSGASFKDGAKRAPTTITEITDALPAVLSTYEVLWTSATKIT